MDRVDTSTGQITMILSRGVILPAAFDTMNIAPLETRMNANVARASACAKINLTLQVLGRRPDGFHDLRSLVVGVDLCDDICLRSGVGNSLALRCSRKELETEENLAYRAATRVAASLKLDARGLLELKKSIPVAAGLGGGSSDAATTLGMCNEVWQAGLSNDELATLGAELGSDVPLFFSLPAAVMTGRGEIVEPSALQWSGWALLACVAEPVITAEVFKAWQPEDASNSSDRSVENICAAKRADEMMPWMFNDLEQAVFRVSPRMKDAHERLENEEFGTMRVTGAGSTLFCLYDQQRTAFDVAKKIEAMGLGITCMVVKAPIGPSPTVIEES